MPAVQNWEDARANALAWMRHWGYDDMRLTPAGAETAGPHLTGQKAVARVEMLAGPVVSDQIRVLERERGSSSEPKMLFFFANPGFVAGAIEAADHLNVGLFAYHVPTGDVTAVNRIAKVWLANGKPADRDPRRADLLAPTRLVANRAWFLALCFALVVGVMVGSAVQAGDSGSSRWVLFGGAMLFSIPTVLCIAVAIEVERMLSRSEGPMRLPTTR